MNTRILAAGVLALPILSACGQSPQPTTSVTVTQPEGESSAQAAPKKLLPEADPAMPDDQYVDISSGHQLMFLYYALSGMPADYEAIARAWSGDYRNTSDTFRKQDILAGLKPRIDAEIEHGKSLFFLRYQIKPELSHYDFATKAFPVGSLRNPASWYVSDNPDFQLEFSNGKAFSSLPVADEGLARELESKVSRREEPDLLVYGVAQEIDPNHRLVRARIVKVEVLGQRGQVVIRYTGP